MLPDDLAFVDRASSLVVARGLMRRPTFDPARCQLVEGPLRLDLYNPWHRTRQLTHPETDSILEAWVAPQPLGHACTFGRVDVVEEAIRAGRDLDGGEYGGDPIAAAAEAFVVTELHVRCVELLYAAGAAVTAGQIWALQESVGSAEDARVATLVLGHARRSADPAVQAALLGSS